MFVSQENVHFYPVTAGKLPVQTPRDKGGWRRSKLRQGVKVTHLQSAITKSRLGGRPKVFLHFSLRCGTGPSSV